MRMNRFAAAKEQLAHIKYLSPARHEIIRV